MFGLALDGIGDVNGDALSDVVIGAPRYPWFHDTGYFGIFLGERGIASDTTERPKPGGPARFELLQNYPNPFNGTTVISYSLKDETFVKLIIFDILGREVRRLVDQKQSVGYYQVQWDGKDNQGRDVGSGVYCYELQVNGKKMVRKMVLLAESEMYYLPDGELKALAFHGNLKAQEALALKQYAIIPGFWQRFVEAPKLKCGEINKQNRILSFTMEVEQ